MRSAKLFLLVLGIFVASESSTLGESKWSMKKLLPAKKKSGSDLLPSPEGNALFREKSAKPSPLKRMTNGTRSMAAKSKEMVPAWMLPKTQERTRKSSSAAKDSFGRLKKEVRVAQKKMAAPWKRMAQPKEDNSEPRTVNEFLSQKRP